MIVVCVKCADCGRLGQKDMKWQKSEDGKEEHLVCSCGGRNWKFVEKASNFIGPDVLVIQKGVEERT